MILKKGQNTTLKNSTLLLCCVAISACSHVSYVKDPTGADRYVSFAKSKNYGALVTADEKDPQTGKITKGHTIMLKRKDRTYMAEKMLSYNDSDDAHFERSYLSLAANHKKKQLGILLRFEY